MASSEISNTLLRRSLSPSIWRITLYIILNPFLVKNLSSFFILYLDFTKLNLFSWCFFRLYYNINFSFQQFIFLFFSFLDSSNADVVVCCSFLGCFYHHSCWERRMVGKFWYFEEMIVLLIKKVCDIFASNRMILRAIFSKLPQKVLWLLVDRMSTL